MSVIRPVVRPLVRSVATPLFRSVFDTSTTALLARMTTQPNSARQSAINSLIVSLKSAGVWDKLDALYIMAAHDAQAAQRNWVADAYNLTPVNSPTFTTDRGYAGNGTTSYIDTGFNPTTAGGKFTLNSASFGIWSRTAGQTASSAAGWFDGTNGVTIHPRDGSDNAGYRINQAASDAASNTNGTGYYSVNRSASGTSRISKNGSSIGAGVQPSSALVNASLRLGSITAASFSNRELAAAAIGQSLTTTEDAAFYSALNTYMVAVGAA